MKFLSMRAILTFALFFSITAQAQWKSYIISVRGDTLNRVDLAGKKQGPWVIHLEELRGEPGYDEQGYYVDDQKDGLWVRFSLMGDKLAEENYRWGVLDGRSKYYTRLGGLLREESWRAVDPNKTMDTVNVYDLKDPTKVIDRVVVKLTNTTYKHGTWNYYDPQEGIIVKSEKYFLDKIQTDADIKKAEVDDDLKPLDVAGTSKTKKESEAKPEAKKPQAILDYEKKNAGKKKIKSRDGNTGY